MGPDSEHLLIWIQLALMLSVIQMTQFNTWTHQN